MFAKALTSITTILLFSACQLQADVINSRWVGGEWGEWENADNWEPPIIPHNTTTEIFNVTVDAGVNEEISISILEHHPINWLNCYGAVDLEMWTDWATITFQDPNGLINYGSDTGIDGDCHNEINGNIKNTKGAQLNLTNLEIEGSLINPEGGKMVVSGVIDTDNGDLLNSGLMLIAPNSEFYVEKHFYNSGKVRIYSGACGSDEELENNISGVIEGSGFLRIDTFLINKGKIYSDNGPLIIGLFEEAVLPNFSNKGFLGNKPVSSLSIKSLETIETINNFGTIEVNAGGGVAFDCNLVNEPNAVIKFLGGTLAAKTITQKADATLNGFGGITGDVVIEPNAVMELIGPTNIVGNLTIGEGATLDLSNGTVLVTGDLTCNNGIIQIMNVDIIILGKTYGFCRRDFIDVVGPTANGPNE